MLKPTESDSLNHLLIQVCRLHHARAHQLFEGIGVYRGQPPVLEALWEQDGQTHSELAARLHVKPATISRMIQRMGDADFLICKPDPDDQRVSRVYLTAVGKAIRPALEGVVRTFEADTFADFTLEERVLMRRLLMQVRENLIRVCGNLPEAEPPPMDDPVAKGEST